MIKHMKKLSLQLGSTGAAVAMLGATEAHANNFSTISANVVSSIAGLPGLLTAVSYMFGLILGVLGILKIKDHVENPGQTPLKDGAIRLLAGGALFALPIIFESMTATLDSAGNGAGATAASMNSVSFNVN